LKHLKKIKEMGINKNMIISPQVKPKRYYNNSTTRGSLTLNGISVTIGAFPLG
jgi:riboflavin synthase alpha subunit